MAEQQKHEVIADCQLPIADWLNSQKTTLLRDETKTKGLRPKNQKHKSAIENRKCFRRSRRARVPSRAARLRWWWFAMRGICCNSARLRLGQFVVAVPSGLEL